MAGKQAPTKIEILVKHNWNHIFYTDFKSAYIVPGFIEITMDDYLSILVNDEPRILNGHLSGTIFTPDFSDRSYDLIKGGIREIAERE